MDIVGFGKCSDQRIREVVQNTDYVVWCMASPNLVRYLMSQQPWMWYYLNEAYQKLETHTKDVQELPQSLPLECLRIIQDKSSLFTSQAMGLTCRALRANLKSDLVLIPDTLPHIITVSGVQIGQSPRRCYQPLTRTPRFGTTIRFGNSKEHEKLLCTLRMLDSWWEDHTPDGRRYAAFMYDDFELKVNLKMKGCEAYYNAKTKSFRNEDGGEVFMGDGALFDVTASICRIDDEKFPYLFHDFTVMKVSN